MTRQFICPVDPNCHCMVCSPPDRTNHRAWAYGICLVSGLCIAWLLLF